MSTAVKSALPRACNACPWRLSNQGKRHAGGWYTKANLRRLWSKLRNGDRMTCHPTDPTNPVPAGYKTVAPEAQTHQCAGAEILRQREYLKFQNICHEREPAKDGLRVYRLRHPHGLTKVGLWGIVEQAIFGNTPFGNPLPEVDLRDADVGYEPLGLDPLQASLKEHAR